MKKLVNYLTFNGNCREAMEFYRECLGGKLTFESLEETAGFLPPELTRCIVQACLTIDGMMLLGTDMVGGEGLLRGNSVSLFLETTDDEELRVIYKNLARSGKPTHPPTPTREGKLFGTLTDRFGNHWLLHCAG